MISGIGVDIVEIERIEKAVKRQDDFLVKLFTEREIDYFKSRQYRSEYIAGRFAAKEAIAKALGTGFVGFSMKDIEIDRNSNGKPIAILLRQAKLIAERSGEYKIHVSISHDKTKAVGYAILELL